MEKRICRLKEYGLKGLEAYYHGFTAELQREAVSLAEKFDLYTTAGSDYHGTNKTVNLGETGLTSGSRPERLRLFIGNFI